MIPQLMGERNLVDDEEWAVERVDFRRVYGEAWPDVFRYAWVLVRHREDAEDVASEAFRRAFESWNAGHGPQGDVKPWLFLITRRVAIDRLRRKLLIRWLPLERAPERAVSADEAAFQRTEVWIWFDQLCRAIPANQREALILRFQFDMSDAEVGRITGTSPANVRTRVSRGLAALRVRAGGLER